MPEEKKQRTANRRKTILGGKVFDEEGRSGECIIVDLSASGARIKSDQSFKMGSVVSIKINKFVDLRAAEVIWLQGNQVGLRFVEKITQVPASMQRIFALLRSGQGGS